MARTTTKADFARNTLTFMTEYSVCPYDGGELVRATGKPLQLMELEGSKLKQKMALTPRTANEVGAYLLSPKGGNTDIQFLPWLTHNIIGTDLASSPKIFFTAAVAGCSVFASGKPANPSVFHAGIGATLDSKVYPAVQGDNPQDPVEKLLVGAAKSKDAPMFWRVLLQKQMPEAVSDPDFAEINKEHYMEDGKHAKPIYDQFLVKLKAKAKEAGVTITFSAGYGCIFGVNDGGWKLYRQLNFVLQYSRMPSAKFKTCLPVSIRQWYPKGKENKELRPEFAGFDDLCTPSEFVIAG